jgi:thiopeptide-type bacteriocin biosynthesis protein
MLTELVRPLVAEVLRPGAADSWFFMRYADPEWHLRLRFHGDPDSLKAFVLPALLRRARPFQENGVLWRLEFERYEPEVERYGGPDGLGVAERFFQLDSELGLDLLPCFMGDEGAELRWRLALCGADRLLSGLGFGDAETKALVEQLQASREQTWTADGSYRQQVAHVFRSVHGRETLAAMLDDPASTLPPEALGAFQRYASRLQSFHDAWQDLERVGRLTAPVPEIAASLVHMHLNRLLRSCHLQQEAVICDFLCRLYATRLARRGQALGPPLLP